MKKYAKGFTATRKLAYFAASVFAIIIMATIIGKFVFKSTGNEVVETSFLKMSSKFAPQISVPYDLETEQNTQESVDQGHSPWRLDPVFTALNFASLKIFPQGIEGEYPIDYDDLRLIMKTNKKAVVKVKSDKTNIEKIYLKRLIKQEESGIWTVVGYDLK